MNCSGRAVTCCRCAGREDIGGWILSLLNVGRECSGVSGPVGHLPGHGPAAGALLCQLVAQHLSFRTTVWWQVFRRDVPTSAARRLQVYQSTSHAFFGVVKVSKTLLSPLLRPCVGTKA